MRDIDIDNNADIIFSNNGGYKEAEPIDYCSRCGEEIYSEDQINKNEDGEVFCDCCFGDLLYDGKWKGEEQKWVTIED